MKNKTFPIINRSSHQVLVGLEPEGDTLSLEPGDTCKIELERPIDEVSFEVVLEDDVFSVYAMCGKRAIVLPSASQT